MSLDHLLPVHPDRAAARRLGNPWPASARLVGGDVRVAGVRLADVAARFGTPVHVLDEEEVRSRARRYRDLFGAERVFYASKAFTCRGLAGWLGEEGLGLDVCSAGELRTALDAGVPGGRLLLHGTAKSPADLQAAVTAGVGRIVLDSPADADLVAAAVTAAHPGPAVRQRVLLRLVPQVAAGAHPKVRTGTDRSQFGTPLADLYAFVDRVAAHPQLDLVGLHCHLGSQITEVDPYVSAVRTMAQALVHVYNRTGRVLSELDLGGGHGVAHLPHDPALDVADLAGRVTGELRRVCGDAGLPVPSLLVEPGRALVATAGVVLYRVAVVKHQQRRTFVVVDGGMGDNPRPALYGSRYAPRLVGRSAAGTGRTVTVVGRYCESGDVLAEDVTLPADLVAGDLLAFPAAGAYQASMSSTYNAVPRPPVVALRAGRARVLVRRETVEDLGRRDVGR